ncbi:hypothetical protein PY257_12425 [Ramlibacter sp. H39-3-26]|nr:hypothetical protein [Ramlibacter sp. H39-3-26]MDF1485973.1 hypothetical protein [Ramlibacter sp. H39-3-26]
MDGHPFARGAVSVVARAVVAKSDKSVALLIQRDGDKIFMPVRLG